MTPTKDGLTEFITSRLKTITNIVAQPIPGSRYLSINTQTLCFAKNHQNSRHLHGLSGLILKTLIVSGGKHLEDDLTHTLALVSLETPEGFLVFQIRFIVEDTGTEECQQLWSLAERSFPDSGNLCGEILFMQKVIEAFTP